MLQGYYILVLHTHLPFVRHPEYDEFLEEDWLYEAITECYIPLLLRFKRLREENLDFRITISLTPPICNMLSDRFLLSRYEKRLIKLIDLINRETKRVQKEKKFLPAIKMYKEKLTEIYDFFKVYKNNFLNAFKEQSQNLEIVTCAATHGFLPLMRDEDEIKWQINVGVQDYKYHFGKKPKGIWLPECGYDERVEKYLKSSGIKFFFLDTHGILYGEPRPKYFVYAPVYTENGLLAFARDPQSSMQVWSSEAGYPGDFRYREFYRDIGYDLPYDYIKPYLGQDGIRKYLGLKYYRITGKVPLDKKEPYVPEWALNATKEHASHFHFSRSKQLEYLKGAFDRLPVIVSPFDTELFGHWWYEGPDFLYYFIKEVNRWQVIKMITPVEYEEIYPDNQLQQPNISTWGDKGYNEVWLNGKNDWIYRHLHICAMKFKEIIRKHPDSDGILFRAINQALRELLLAQSSDWAFLITCNTAIYYAEKRTKDHIHNFLKLNDFIVKNEINESFLNELEDRNNIFPWLDYRKIV